MDQMLSMFCNIMITIGMEQTMLSSNLSYQQGNQVSDSIQTSVLRTTCALSDHRHKVIALFKQFVFQQIYP